MFSLDNAKYQNLDRLTLLKSVSNVICEHSAYELQTSSGILIGGFTELLFIFRKPGCEGTVFRHEAKSPHGIMQNSPPE